MRSAGVLQALVLLSVTLMAGCVGGDEAGAQSDAGEPVPASFEGEGADLAGVVIDDESLPVGDALVALLDQGRQPVAQVPSDADGRFNLVHVAPGSYVLAAQRLGYESESQQLDVEAGQDQTELVLELVPLRPAEPYYQTQPAVMEIQLGLAWAVGGDFNQGCIMPGVTCQGLGLGTTTLGFEVEETEQTPLAEIFFEEVWEPNLVGCSRGITVDFYGPGTSSTGNPSFSNPDYWSNNPHPEFQISTPIEMRIPRVEPGNPDAIEDPAREELNDGKPLDTSGTWTVRNFPPGAGLTNLPADANCFLEQKMDLYFTAFFIDPSPEGFRARPDV